MRIGIISDLHLEFRKEHVTLLNSIVSQCQEEKVDLIINAGDTHPDSGVRGWFEDELIHKLKCKYIEVLGNHDYYGNEFNNDFGTRIVNKIKIKWATLWTNFDNNPFVKSAAGKFISDFKEIKNISTSIMEDAFYQASEHLFNSTFDFDDADIIVTHFGLHTQSIHPKYFNNRLNPYFINDLDHKVEQSKTKLFIHGHTHERFDYEVGNSRIICNPCGYPGENGQRDQDYKVKVVEV